MPIQAPSWTDFLSCPICCNEFAVNQRLPISLGCGHTICRQCLATLHNRQCPFDQTAITTSVDNLPINNALLQLVSTNNGSTSPSANVNAGDGNNSTSTSTSTTTSNNNNNNNASGVCGSGSDSESAAIGSYTPPSVRQLSPGDLKFYKVSKQCIENLALHLKSLVTNNCNFSSVLSRPMQRKLVTLVNCQLMVVEGRVRVLRAARSLGERTVTELLLQHQNPQQLSSNLWAAVRARGCQFLGPAMQEEVLKLVLQALQDGSALSRKVLVMYVVQRLEPRFPQASKTSIGHVVQLLYRASCFKVSKREADSSLMQLKEEFRTYDALRREHDAQIVQIATESGLRIAPDQWSALLYGDTVHKSHMQSIIDKLQTPYSFSFSVQELVIALQRTGDPSNLSSLHQPLRNLASIDPSAENSRPTWQDVAKALLSVRRVIVGLVEFMQHYGNRKLQECTSGQSISNSKYKISLCRDLTVRRNCPRGMSCTFAHSEEELERYRARCRKGGKGGGSYISVVGALSNVTNVKKDYPSHGQNYGYGHGTHPTGMLHPGNDTSAPASAVTSPLRFGGGPPVHAKLTRGGYGDAVSPLHSHGPQPMGAHHHMRPLHHSPIPPNNGQQMSMPSSNRYDTPGFNTLNYPSQTSGPPSRMPHGMGNMNASPIGMRNATGGVLSPRNFSASLQPPPQLSAIPPNLTNANPPKYQNNNNAQSALGSPLNSKSLYNVLSPEFYNSGMLGVNTRPSSLFNSSPNSGVGNNSGAIGNNSNGNNVLIDYKSAMEAGGKLRPPNISPMWDQQLVGNTPAVSDILSGAVGTGNNTSSNQHSIYSTNDTSSLFCKKAGNLNIELNKTLNGLEISDSYTFKPSFGGNNNGNFPNNTATTAMPNKDAILCGNLPASHSSFWNTHNLGGSSGATGGGGVGRAGVGVGATNPQDGSSMAHCMGLGPPSSATAFRDRDTFVRSDSILDDDAATFDVPVTAAAMGSKFGPICPIYKGHGSNTSTVPNTNTYLDNWNSVDTVAPSVKNANSEHQLLERNSSGDMNFSVFSNDAENNIALQFHQQLQRNSSGSQQLQRQQQQQMQQSQQQHQHQLRSSTFDNFALQSSLLPDFNHINNMSRASAAGDGANYDLGLNTLQNMTTSIDDNGNIDLNKGSSMNELMWNKQLKSIRKIWNDRKQQQQQQQQQQQLQQQQITRVNSKGRNTEESIIDSGRMRDLEQELSEIVDKEWSNADDGGIKRE